MSPSRAQLSQAFYAVIADCRFAGLYKRAADAERRRADLATYPINWKGPPQVFRVATAEDLPDELHQRVAFGTLRDWLEAGWTGKHE